MLWETTVYCGIIIAAVHILNISTNFSVPEVRVSAILRCHLMSNPIDNAIRVLVHCFDWYGIQLSTVSPCSGVLVHGMIGMISNYLLYRHAVESLWISSFFYKFVFYTFVFYMLIFYNSKFISSLFIWFTFYTFVFYMFVFYTVHLFILSLLG